MAIKYYKAIKKSLFLSFFISIAFSQLLDNKDIVYNELRDIVETASRSQQVVWLEDFTGIDWPYCPAVSFAIDRLLQDYPQTLMTIEWHSDALTYSDTIDFPIPEEYSYRASLYDVGGIPHNQFNGIYEFVGGASNCAWQNFLMLSKAFKPKFRAMKDNVQSHGAATIRTGGAANWVKVPPTDTLTKRIPIVA